MSGRPADAEFSAFVATSWPSLYRTAYLMVGSHAQAEDLAQTALTNTYASWHRIRDLGAARAYARTAVVHSATSWFRTRSRRGEWLTDAVPDRPAPEWEPDTPDVAAALRRLPPRQRAVVVLRFYEDLSVAQTADALECSEGTVKSQTFAALNNLRTSLGEAVVPGELSSERGDRS